MAFLAEGLCRDSDSGGNHGRSCVGAFVGGLLGGGWLGGTIGVLVGCLFPKAEGP
jgi:hypothetical protein